MGPAIISIISITLALFTIASVVFLVMANRDAQKRGENIPVKPKNIDPNCCGAHEVCDFELMKANPEMIEYYEDEELDELSGIDPQDYTNEQIDQLREVLYTLSTHDIRKWLLSIERRDIALPDFLQQEARDLITTKE